MQPGKRDRIAPIGLYPPTWSLRDQSRGDHHAVVAEFTDLAIQPAGGWAGLVANAQLTISVGQLPDHPRDRCRLVSISPTNRTSPPRPLSAKATACFIFATSKLTNAPL
jgi:hypothetical protein